MYAALFACFLNLVVLATGTGQEAQPPGDTQRSAQPSAENRKNENGETFWQRTTQDPVALFTGMLALFTGVLIVVSCIQIRFLNRADKTARITAEAAKKSADAAVGIALPIIRMFLPDLIAVQSPTPASFSGVITDGNPTKYSGISQLRFSNDGSTPAFPTELCVGWAVVDNLPDIPVYRRVITCAPGEIVKPEGDLAIRIDCVIELTDDEISQFRLGTSHLWIYCTLVYRDFLDNLHEQGFCLGRSVGSKTRWARYAGTPTAYTRKT